MQFIKCPHCGLKHSLRETGQCPRCQNSVQEQSADAGAPYADTGPDDVYAGPDDVHAGPDPEGVYQDQGQGPDDGGVYQGPEPGGVYSESDPPADVYDGQPEGAGVYRAPSVPSHRTRSAAHADLGVPVAAKIAGVVIAILSVVNVAVSFDSGGDGLLNNPSTGITLLLIDLVLVVMLFANNEKALLWTKIRVILGGIIFTAVYASSGQPVEAVVNVIMVAALLSLLLGRPGVLRTVLGSVACAGILLLAGVGLLLTSGLLSQAAIATGALEEVPENGLIQREEWSYTVSVPEGDWYVLDREQAVRQNPLADVWLMRPSLDAHVIIIPESLEAGQFVSLKDFASIVKSNAKSASKDFEVRGERTMRAANRMAHLLHTRAKIDGMKLEYYYGLVVQHERIYQVVCFSSQKHFDEVESDFMKIIRSFELSDVS